MPGGCAGCEAGAPIPGKVGLAAFDFDNGTLVVTEAGSRKQASLHVLRGADEVAALDPGGLEVLRADRGAVRSVLRAENHTLKRALTDPHLFSGIGNAYSDEILHAARLSPLKLTQSLTDGEIAALFTSTRLLLHEWTERLHARAGREVPGEGDRLPQGMAVHGRYRPAVSRAAARRSSASSTPATKPTTARPARPAAGCSPTARCRGCCTTTGRGRWKSSSAAAQTVAAGRS